MSWWKKSPNVDESRWVALDVETSGLDAGRDRLLAIAAIGIRVDWALRQLAIVPADSFEVILQQEAVSNHDNILLHGIGVQRQRGGVAPALALAGFTQFCGNSPLLAFHSAFDEMVIQRHLKLHRCPAISNPWVDIEHLCGIAYPQVRARALDEWMVHFNIQCAVRHQAAADTLAECELLLRIWPRLAPECRRWADVQKLAARQRWMTRV